MADRQQARGRRRPEGPRRREPFVLRRGRRDQHDAQHRPDAVNLKPRDKRSGDRHATSSAGCGSPLASVAGISSYMQPVQDLTIDDRVSRTQYQFVLESANPDDLGDVDPEADGPPAPASRDQRRRDRPVRERAWPPTSTSTATRPPGSASPRRRSTTPSMTRSASASSRPSSPNRTSTG